MAMIECPDCGKTISDKAPVCPNCGRPIASQGNTKKVKLEKESIAYIVFAALALVAAFLPYSYQGLIGIDGKTLLSKTQYNLWTVTSTGATGKEGNGVQLFWHIVLLSYLCICVIGIVSFFIKNEKLNFRKIRLVLPFVAAVLYALYEIIGTKYYKEFNDTMYEIGQGVFKCGRSLGFYVIIASLIGWIIMAIYIKTKAPKEVET